jgi:hypothetical protein
MPYITQDKRDKLDPIIEQLLSEIVNLQLDDFDSKNNTEGNMNYIISRLLVRLYADPISYRNMNDAVGMLECCKMEFYRRTAFYEDQKIVENGDVYPTAHDQ